MKKSLRKKFALVSTVLTAGSVVVSPLLEVAAETPKFDTAIKKEDKAIEGGTFKYAMVGDNFSGLFSPVLAEISTDIAIIEMFNPGIFGFDESFRIDDSGLAKLEFDQAAKTAIITIPEDVKWDDGEPLTIDDVILPYKIIGHKDYTGVRYNDDFANIVGMDAYHKGEAEEIEGLERIDDYTLKITYNNVSPSMQLAGGGVCQYIEPSHVIGDIPVTELEDSEYVRSTPVGFGAWKVESIVPGESVRFVPNEHYYKGKVTLDALELEVVSASTAVSEMKAGNYDFAELPVDEYDSYKDASNFSILGDITNTFTYIGFRFGTKDPKTNEPVMDESKIVNNKALRQALAYAINNDAVAEKFFHSIRQRANSPITPNFTDVYASEIKGYNYDPEKAQKLLAEAGFEDKNGDGFLETPEGEEMKLTFAAMSGSEIAEPLAQYYVEAWKAIGVNVELLNGRLLELNTFYDMLNNDSEDVDLFQAGQGIGGDPNPYEMYGRLGGFNRMRYASEKNDELIDAINSEKSFDAAYRKQAYLEWQEFMMDELPIIPTLFRYSLVAVNNRVNTWDIKTGSDLDWNQITLNADAPAK